MRGWLVRGGRVAGRRMGVRATREVIMQGLDRGYARVTDQSASDLGDGLIGHAGCAGDFGKSALVLVQIAQHHGHHWLLIYPHGHIQWKK